MHVFQILGRNVAHLRKVRISLLKFQHLKKKKEEINVISNPTQILRKSLKTLVNEVL